MKSKRRKLLLINTLPCEQSAGGPVQLFRHFIENDDFDFDIFIADQGESSEYLKTGLNILDRLLKRLSQTRLFPEFVAFNLLIAEHRQNLLISEKLLTFKPDAIVTVAFGSYCFLASKIAQKFNLPLITFFHDWYSDLTYCRGVGKKLVDKRFKRLYQQSDLALCVSESMQSELGKHRNSVVLYPIPNLNPINNSSLKLQDSYNNLFKVVYLGLLGGDHGEVLQLLVDKIRLKNTDWLDLRLYGFLEGWTESNSRFVISKNIYKGRPSHGLEANNALSEADVFLVVQSFSQSMERRVRTSFPSKILEYVAYGKPIVVWGPSNSSSVKFIEEHHTGVVVTNPNPEDLLQILLELKNDRSKYMKMAIAAKKLSESIFDPRSIHSQMVSAINSTIDTFVKN